MKKSVVILLLAISSLANAQVNWTVSGSAFQTKSNGTGRDIRVNLGSPGFFNISDSIRNAMTAPLLLFNNGLTRTGNNITTDLSYFNSRFIQLSPSSAQSGNININGNVTASNFNGTSSNSLLWNNEVYTSKSNTSPNAVMSYDGVSSWGYTGIDVLSDNLQLNDASKTFNHNISGSSTLWSGQPFQAVYTTDIVFFMVLDGSNKWKPTDADAVIPHLGINLKSNLNGGNTFSGSQVFNNSVTVLNTPTNPNDVVRLSDLNTAMAGTNTVTSASTFSPTSTGYYTFNGTSSTWTLPSLSGNTGVRLLIMNQGSGMITVNTSGGENEIYNGSNINSITINSGEIAVLYNNSISWFKQL